MCEDSSYVGTPDVDPDFEMDEVDAGPVVEMDKLTPIPSIFMLMSSVPILTSCVPTRVLAVLISVLFLLASAPFFPPSLEVAKLTDIPQVPVAVAVEEVEPIIATAMANLVEKAPETASAALAVIEELVHPPMAMNSSRQSQE